MKAWAYAVLVLLLLGFGYLAIFSIGAPFLLLGLMLAVLFPWRDRRGVIETGTAVILGFVVGYLLVAPLSCTARMAFVVGEERSEGTTVCSNLLGIPYEGDEDYNPGLLPSLLAALALATTAGVATAWYYRRHPTRPPVDAVARANGP